jgi:hypothetical protein
MQNVHIIIQLTYAIMSSFKLFTLANHIIY